MDNIIADSINAWKQAVEKKEDKLIVDLFEKGNAFRYEVPPYAQDADELHVYPGIKKGHVFFFVIPAKYDTPEFADTYDQYTETCPLELNMGGNQIPEEEAKFRIRMWNEHHASWIPKQNATVEGLFLAFVIERQDFESKDNYVNLALKSNGEEKIKFTADLVVTNLQDTNAVYDDFARPVPPFGASAATDFYLLSV